MKSTSTFLAVIVAGLALLFLTASARAQTPTYSPQTLTSFTNGPAAGTNINVVLDVRKQASVAVAVNQKSNGTNVTSAGFWYELSVDGTKYGNGRFITCTPSGTTEAVTITNLNTFGCGYLRIPYFTNINDVTGITNATIKYAIKISAP